MEWQQVYSGAWAENNLDYLDMAPAFPGLGKSLVPQPKS